MRRISSVWVGWVVWALCGCPNVHEVADGGSRSDAHVDVDAAIERLADAYCEASTSCIFTTHLAFDDWRVERASPELCGERTRVWMAQTFELDDPDAIDACVASLRGECFAPVLRGAYVERDTLPGCEALYPTGPTAVGDPCIHHAQCARGSFCIERFDECSTADRVCTPVDSECAVDSQCPALEEPEQRAACVRGDDGRTCAGVERVDAAASEGEICGWTPLGPRRWRETLCREGLHCMFEARDTPSRCRRPPTEGEACGEPGVASLSFCAFGLVCDSERGVCVAPSLVGREGASCRIDVCDPRAGLVCDRRDSICRGATGEEGSGCSELDPRLACGAGLRCTSGGTCISPRGDGERCTHGSECESDSCDVDTRTCVASCG